MPSANKIKVITVAYHKSMWLVTLTRKRQVIQDQLFDSVIMMRNLTRSSFEQGVSDGIQQQIIVVCSFEEWVHLFLNKWFFGW